MTGKHRVPREVAKAAGDLMISAIKNHCRQIEICGSYRRGKADCGDVDILVVGCDFTPQEGHQVHPALVAFHDACDTVFVSGEAKVRGMKNDVQVEIRLVPEECWGAALMHTTGSAELNVQQRALAKAKGMALNEYGLWKVNPDGSKTLLASRTEEEIYQQLGIPFLEPTQRNLESAPKPTVEIQKKEEEIRVEVMSTSNPNKQFVVRYRPEKQAWDCNCPDFKWRAHKEGRDCKHIAKVKEARGV